MGNLSELTFKQFEDCLAFMHNISEEKRPTFRSRLKQWQKMGLPEFDPVGRGVRHKYTLEHMYQTAVLMGLLRLGLTPERAIDLVKIPWPQFRAGFLHWADQISTRSSTATVYAIVSLNALYGLTDDGTPIPGLSVLTVDDEDMGGMFSPSSSGADDIDDDDRRAQLACGITLEIGHFAWPLLRAVRMNLRAKSSDVREEVVRWRREHAEWLASADRLEMIAVRDAANEARKLRIRERQSAAKARREARVAEGKPRAVPVFEWAMPALLAEEANDDAER